MDEPESMGASAWPAREKLDNLVIVVNCNLQRLDGPVRGNSKISRNWKPISVAPAGTWSRSSGAPAGMPAGTRQGGILQQVMMETVDGEYQNYKAKDGAYVRKHSSAR